MQVNEFTSLLKTPADITRQEQVNGLEQVLAAYPYFQAASAMRLIGLKNTNSFTYNAALKKHAALTADRSWLFELITENAFTTPTTTAQKTPQVADASALKKTLPTPTQQATSKKNNPLEAQTQIGNTQTKQTLQSNAAKKELGLGTPLIFNKNERHSFEAWLSLSAKDAPINTETAKNNKEDKKAKTKSRIDAFIANNPKIEGQYTPSAKISIKNSLTINKEALMTETLARVYLEQNKYKKALQAYKILSLKYPEKNSFFASQIKAIQKLIKDHT